LLTAAGVVRYAGVSHPPFVDYRRWLKRSARALRQDPTPAERKLWFEFLRDLPVRFTRQKPVDGDSHFTSAGERYDACRTAELEATGVQVLRFTNPEVMQQFEAVCQRIRDTLKI
jgi:very-short-patch-repair endonuclease